MLYRNANDLLTFERVGLVEVSFQHFLASFRTRFGQFDFSGVCRVVFAIPESMVSYVLPQPRFSGTERTGQHVSHQAFFACDRFEVLIDVANLRMKFASREVP